MPLLAEIQTGVHHAVATGDFAAISPLLVGGQAPEHRLAIHRRHYETTLITALLDKFPATTWLVGSRLVSGAAKLFVAAHPPCTPCIAEYGEDFPAFLATCRGADRVAYLCEFAQLEWHIAQVAIAVDEPALRIEELSTVVPELLPDAVLILQSGVRYLHAFWPVDELMKVYLAGTAPERLEFEPAEIWLEIRGARAEFRIDRIEFGDFIFRESISKGNSIGDAAEKALDADTAFNPGSALRALVAGGGLVTGIVQPAPGQRS